MASRKRCANTNGKDVRAWNTWLRPHVSRYCRMGDYYTAQHCHVGRRSYCASKRYSWTPLDKHFHPRHPTGNVTDCGSETCLRSANHKHKNVPDCGCTEVRTFIPWKDHFVQFSLPKAYTVRNRIQNTFRTRCPRCDPQAHPPEL